MDFLRLKSCNNCNSEAAYSGALIVSQTGQGLTRNSGFSIVEVLVSIVILAIGVIGAAGMQLAAVRAARQTMYQTFVSHLAAEMGDAIRAGERWASKNSSADPYLGANFDAVLAAEPTPPARSCYSDDCNPTEFAAFEIHEWKMRIRNAVPGGQFLICRDSSPWSGDQNSLIWECRDGEAGTAPIVVKLGWQTKNPDGSLTGDAANRIPPGIALTVSPGA